MAGPVSRATATSRCSRPEGAARRPRREELRPHSRVIRGAPMTEEVKLYDGHYSQLSADPQVAVRRRTYDEDLGQSGWLTAAQAVEFFRLLELGPGQRALEVACGSGGVTCRMAVETGATCVGVDINPHGIHAAETRAREQELSSRVSFQMV